MENAPEEEGGTNARSLTDESGAADPRTPIGDEAYRLSQNPSARAPQTLCVEYPSKLVASLAELYDKSVALGLDRPSWLSPYSRSVLSLLGDINSKLHFYCRRSKYVFRLIGQSM